MITLKNVKKVYQTKKGVCTTALDNICLSLPDKGLVFLVGDSGSGKSTFLNILGGLDTVTSGEVLIDGNAIHDFTEKDLDCYRNSYIGFVFQEFNVLSKYNVYQNIELVLRLQNQKISREKIDHLLEKLGLNHLGLRKMNELSGGQKQRVALARALVKNPTILLADEPTGNLDQASGQQIFELLKSISKEKLVVVVSHDEEAAQKYADRIIEIEDGKIKKDTNPTVEGVEKPFIRKKFHLPFSYALKMAFTSLTAKPIKGLMTILLTAFSLVFMGFSINAYLFDEASFFASVLRDNHKSTYTVASIGKTGIVSNLQPALSTDEVSEEFFQKTDSLLNPIYYMQSMRKTTDETSRFPHFSYGTNENQNSLFYYQEPPSFSLLEIKDERVVGPIMGSLPEKENEIVIHPYLADYMIKFGVIDEQGELYFPKSRESLLEDKRGISFEGVVVYITGIQIVEESRFLKSKEEEYFPTPDEFSYFRRNYWQKAESIYTKGLKDYLVKSGNALKANLKEIYLVYRYGEQSYFEKKVQFLKEPISCFTLDGKKEIRALQENEIILSFEFLKQMFPTFEEEFQLYLENHQEEVYESVWENFFMQYVKENQVFEKLNKNLKVYDFSNDKEIPISIVGICLEDTFINPTLLEQINYWTIRCRYIVYDDNFSHVVASFKTMLSPYDMSYTNWQKNASTKSFTYDLGFAESDIENVVGDYKQLKFPILIISIVFSLFSFFLFSNFLATSISYAQKEIGILHSLGASKKDRIKIFAYETLLIGFLSWLVSVAGLLISCKFLNQSFFTEKDFVLNAIVLKPFVFVYILIYVVLIALFVTIACISKLNKMDPVAVLLNR